MARPIRVAFLVPDDRFGRELEKPFFGPAPTGVLEGFQKLGPSVVEVHIVSCVEKNLPAPTKLQDNIFYHQIEFPHWRFLRTLHSGPVLGVRRLLAKIKPDIVHSQGVERWCALSGALSGFPAVLTIHGNLREINRVAPLAPFHYWKTQEWLGQFAIPRHHGILCNSDYTEKCLRPFARRTWRVDNPIRSEFFAPRTSNCTSTPVPILLNVGLVQPRKRQVEIAKEIVSIIKEGYLVKIRFIGGMLSGDEYGRQLLDICSEHPYCLEYAGLRGIDELIEEFDHASGLVHFPTEEAFGLVVAEALARQHKLFAASVGGIVDIASDSPGADLVGVEDFAGLRSRIIDWLKSGAPRFPDAASSIAGRYHPIEIARKHMDVYTEVLSG